MGSTFSSRSAAMWASLALAACGREPPPRVLEPADSGPDAAAVASDAAGAFDASPAPDAAPRGDAASPDAARDAAVPPDAEVAPPAACPAVLPSGRRADPVAGGGCAEAIDFFALATPDERGAWRAVLSTVGAGNESTVSGCGGWSHRANDLVLRLAPPRAAWLRLDVRSPEHRGVFEVRPHCEDPETSYGCRWSHTGDVLPRYVPADPAQPAYLFVDGEEQTQQGPVEITVEVEPVAAPGEDCLPGAGCLAGHACLQSGARWTWTCVPVEPPVIEEAIAFVGADRRSFGLRVAGRRGDFRVLTAAVEIPHLRDPPYTLKTIALDLDPETGRFSGEGRWHLGYRLAEGVARRFELAVYDYEGGRTAAPLREVPTPVARAGEACDPARVFSACEAGTVCDGERDRPATCRVAMAECPDGWEVVDLGVRRDGDVWRYESTFGAADHTWILCEARGPERAHRFTAPAAGAYTFDLRAPDTPVVLDLRRDCGAEEIADGPRHCEAHEDWARRVLHLAAGETVYPVADAPGAAADTPYVLEIRSVSPLPEVRSAEVFLQPDGPALGLRLTGDWPAGPPAEGFRLEVVDAEGLAVASRSVAAGELRPRAGEGETLEASGRASLSTSPPRLDTAVAGRAHLPGMLPVPAVLRAPPALRIGEPCDVHRAFDVCPAGTSCVGDPPACAAENADCPADRPAVDLDAHRAAHDTWRYRGVVARGPDRAQGCPDPWRPPAPDAAQAVHRFTAPSEGTYDVRAFGENRSLRLFARTHCGVDGPATELACDAIGNQRYGSYLSMRLAAGERAYVVVEEQTSRSGGPYTLEVHGGCPGH